jgi:hypothetical protein
MECEKKCPKEPRKKENKHCDRQVRLGRYMPDVAKPMIAVEST